MNVHDDWQRLRWQSCTVHSTEPMSPEQLGHFESGMIEVTEMTAINAALAAQGDEWRNWWTNEAGFLRGGKRPAP
jgi:hypothetical protein